MAGMTDDQPALALQWVQGMTTDVPCNVVDLTTTDIHSARVCYLAAHTAVIYDRSSGKQTFLQGHANSISCLAASDDRSIVITADRGAESMLVLWDSHTGSPRLSIQQPHAHGVIAMDVSPDSDWLATVSAPAPDTGDQEIALWLLSELLQPPAQSSAAPQPTVLSTIPAGDTQHMVRFNMNNTAELISNGRRRVYFWAATHGSPRFKYYSPPLRSKDFKQAVGNFVMSVFVPGSQQALTATTDGDLVVWDEQGITAQMGTKATDRRAAKLMRVHQQPLTFLGNVGDYIVSGGKDGFVRFYDPLLRIVAWFEDLAAGPIQGVSFSLGYPTKSVAGEGEVLNKFIAPDFVVATTEGKLLLVASSAFEEFDASRRTGTLLLEPLPTQVVDLACHPTQPEVAIVSGTGLVQRWDLTRHTCLASRSLCSAPGRKVAYSRDGMCIVAAVESNHIYILSTADLSDVHVGRNTQHDITLLATAATCRHVAVADAQHQVLLYSNLPYKHTMRWEYVGKARSHHAKVTGLVFGESPSGQTQLFSLGADNRIVEYGLFESTPATGLMITQHHDFAGEGQPTALSFAPPLPYYKQHSSRTLLLITEDTFKIKLYDPVAKACVATYLGPTFGGPVCSLLMFKTPGSEGSLLAYNTAERIIGLTTWPLDGDPARCVGLIAHPGSIQALAVSHNGRRLVTTGTDGTLCTWSVSASVLMQQVADSEARPNRWEQVLDNPDLLEELQDYFVYAQIKAQGEEAMQPREVSGMVPVHLVPDVMRAVGFYPSEAQVQDIMHNVRFISQTRDVDSLTHLDLPTFLQLYINHRSLSQPSVEDLAHAFTALGANPNTGRVQREALLSQLQQMGEAMTADELVETLTMLTGTERMSEAMPSTVDAQVFASQVLGFEEPKPHDS